jgi:N-acetylglutamate synthase-like GNAT family acetyltransferase
VSSPATDPLHFRLAGPADAGALERLINSAFLVERFFIEGDRINAETVQRLMGVGQFLIAQDDNGVHGCVYVEPRGARAYLGLLSVDPARQRNGLGSRLVEEAENHARTAGMSYMDLRVVNLRKELPEFYRRLGYVVTGTSPVPADVMTKQLSHFINMSKGLTSG